MDALSYEYLIRKAYNCGRGGADGKAEADDYRKLERAERMIEIRNSTKSLDDLKYDYRKSAVKISMNISEALRKVENTFYFTDENKQYKQLLSKLSNEVSMSMDKKAIDKVIEEVEDIFMKLKLKMG